jgi:hypothetical protein
MLRRIACLGLAAVLAAAAVGCGAGGGRGKNKDYDRPSTADTGKK